MSQATIDITDTADGGLEITLTRTGDGGKATRMALSLVQLVESGKMDEPEPNAPAEVPIPSNPGGLDGRFSRFLR